MTERANLFSHNYIFTILQLRNDFPISKFDVNYSVFWFYGYFEIICHFGNRKKIVLKYT